jgi:hypothetical protein
MSQQDVFDIIMELQVLSQSFSICKIRRLADADLSDPLWFLASTGDELSLVCESENVPADTIAREDGWRGFRVAGVLDFSMTGVLASFSSLLADSGVSIFAISTYNTDYIFTKSDRFDHAITLLKEAGYRIV